MLLILLTPMNMRVRRWPHLGFVGAALLFLCAVVRAWLTIASAGPNESADHMKVICGRVQGGQRNAPHWLAKFNEAYSRKTGMAIFLGSLNLCLEHDFDWLSFVSSPSTIRFGKEEYGGERDILLLPCRLTNLDNRRAFLWTTTTAIRDRTRRSIEIITDVKLREAHGLADGSVVELEIAV